MESLKTWLGESTKVSPIQYNLLFLQEEAGTQTREGEPQGRGNTGEGSVHVLKRQCCKLILTEEPSPEAMRANFMTLSPHF